MDEMDLFRNFRRGVAAPSAEAQRRASARLASALDAAVDGEKAARLRHSRRRWSLVALAVVILVGGFSPRQRSVSAIDSSLSSKAHLRGLRFGALCGRPTAGGSLS